MSEQTVRGMPVTTSIDSAMTADEARGLTNRIKAATEQLWALLYEAHERGAWTALGYSSWGDYIAGEFPFSRQHSYRLLDKAEATFRLADAAGLSPVGDRLTERDAMSIKPHLGAAVEDVRELVAEGMKPEAAVEKVVEKYTSPLAPLMTSASPEWYTPKGIVDRVISVMGAIDLDPCADAEKRVPALRHFAKDDDGLARQWSGRVYMNPPYGDEIAAWVEKLADEHQQGRVEQAIALVPARVDTGWWWHVSVPVAFVRGRLKFSGHENSAPFPSALLYFGESWDVFAETFNRDGFARCYLPAEYAE